MGHENEKTKQIISQYMVYLMIALMIITGSINTIANKLQSISVSLDRKYNHNWFITFCMFLGETLCLFVYYGINYLQKRKQNNAMINNNNTNNNDQDYQTIENKNEENNQTTNVNKLPEASPYQLMLPAFCDFFGSSIMTIGLGLIASSVYQMLRGSLILFTTLFSVI